MEPILVVEVAARATVAVGDPASMDLDVDESLPPVMADPGLLERVLVNLLENALRHSGSADVALRARATGTAVVVDVVDHGAGPSDGDGTGPKREHRLGRSSTDSSGLGLTIVEGFTRAMGVQVSRRETAGGGLTVSLELQRAPG
jgi:two-component system sensor histidine kinase KdpD